MTRSDNVVVVVGVAVVGVVVVVGVTSMTEGSEIPTALVAVTDT